VTNQLKQNFKSIKKEYKNLFQNKALMKIITAGFVSSLGSKISYFALLKKVYDLSNGKITNLGFLAIAECLPFIFFGALAGIVIDRFSRKKIMILSDFFSGFITLSIIFVNNLNLIYLIAFISAMVNVFRIPAQRSFEPNLVKREDIPLLNSFIAINNNLVMIVGSALGAAVVGFVGVRNAFIFDSVSFFISCCIIFTIFINEGHLVVNPENKEVGYLEEFRAGTSIMWKNKTLKLIILIDQYVNFTMAMQGPLIYILLKQSFHLGDKAEVAWGILLSSVGVGAVLGSFAIGILVKKHKNKLRLFLNILIFDSVFFTLFILNRYFPLSIVLFAFLGCIETAHSIILNSTIQSIVPDESRGKVFSAIGMISSPVAILSILIGTTASEIISAKNVLLLVAGLEALIAIGVRFTKTYREYENYLEN